MRQRAMASLAGDDDVEERDRGHDRSVLPLEGSQLSLRPVVQAVDLLHRTALEQAVLDHLVGAGFELFRRLEHQIDRAVEVAGFREILRRPQQHRRMPIVPARMHHARIAAGVRQPGRLLDRQRIHVRPQPDRPIRRASANNPDHTVRRHAGDDLIDAKFRQLLPHDARGARLLHRQFRMRVQILPPCGHFRM